MALKLVTAPVSLPIERDDAKAHLNVDFDDDNDLIDALIGAATDSAEQFTGRALIDQTWDFYLDAFPANGCAIYIPKPPLIEVQGVYYADASGNEQQYAAASYVVDNASEKARIALAAPGGMWPAIQSRINAVRIRFRAGFLRPDSPDVANVPPSIIAGIKLTIGALYAQREQVVVGQIVFELPWGARELLRQYRVHTGIG